MTNTKEVETFEVRYYSPTFPYSLVSRWEGITDYDAFKKERILEDPKLRKGSWFVFDSYGFLFRI